MNHQTSSVPQIAYQTPQVSTQLMNESPLVDSVFVVLVFSPGDDLIACLNKAMAFLRVVASSRFPSTNNQLRTLSNLRNQATIQDGRVTVQQVQERQGQNYSGTGYKSNATSSGGNNASGQAKIVKCYNCQDEEQLAFLADPGVLDGQAIQTIIPNNAAFQTEDLDSYDFDCKDILNAKVVLKANISNYCSDVILELYVMASNGYLPTLVFSPEQGFNRVLKGRGTVVATGRVEQGMIKVGEEIEIMGLIDEEETMSRPKADALFIPRENVSALVIRPLETWPGNVSTEKPKGVSSPPQTNGEYTEFASSSHQNGRHTDNGNGTTEFDDVNGIRMETMKEVPPTAYEVDAMKKQGTLSSIIDPRLGNSFTAEGMEEYIQLIVRCVEVSSERRPTMSYIVTELDRILEKEMSLTTIMGEGTPVVTLGSQLFRAAK
ncbi:integrase, catalytic region, zinc finger, CCHC-type containing protein [Tanacetum coccineum]|uniref:Integrase, catalytic region, zinc finger, CCHC-type containing protein n=1 Tax=Tanacetum coccineum TaxID=301880 RepID=A0ABQ5FZ98_9ASTR